MTLFFIVWLGLGLSGSIQFFRWEDDIRVSDLFLIAVSSYIGPLMWALEFIVHWDSYIRFQFGNNKVVFKKRAK